MSTGIQESGITEPKKRRRKAKSSRETSLQSDAKKQKVYFYLSSEAIKRVGVAASMRETDRSSVVESALREQLKGVVFYDLGAKSYDQVTEATEEGSAS